MIGYSKQTPGLTDHLSVKTVVNKTISEKLGIHFLMTMTKMISKVKKKKNNNK